MFNSFRMLTSNLLEEEQEEDHHDLPSEPLEERRSLLGAAQAGEGEEPTAPVSGNSLSTATSMSSARSTASTSHSMNNPQDDLEQQQQQQQSAAVGSEEHNGAVTTPTTANISTGHHQRLPARKEPQSLQATTAATAAAGLVARRRGQQQQRRRRRRHRSKSSDLSEKDKELAAAASSGGPFDTCVKTICLTSMVRNTLTCVNVMARVVVWSSVVALAAGVIWYSYELKNNGTDPHLIAWFSAGAFVLLGFPLSMGSIVAHLANYNQPHVQCYIVRILWMVPIYSMESWLCLRFHEYAIYIETLRDCYESFVLYSFLQFLIEVLGGEETLILMLKDKSPTRGSHMWGFQWCIKPWLMGQPVRRSEDGSKKDKTPSSPQHRHRNSLKRVHWKSPFFVQCKFGVLQYVLLKFVCSFLAMILELHGLYKEGDFTYKGGYLYICFVTNISQCWALYCMILFYYATHNELGPIRPVGKFLSVKALVFFTWWQSVAIGILYQMELIPHYNDSKTTIDLSPEDVAKGIQDYLICVEMFFAAIVHTLVFPHSEYSPQAVQARARALNQSATNPAMCQQRKRLGRHHQYHTNQVLRNYHHQRDDNKSSNSESKSSFSGGVDRSFFDLEMTTLSSGGGGGGVGGGLGAVSWDDPSTVDEDDDGLMLPLTSSSPSRMRGVSLDSVDSDLDLSPMVTSPGSLPDGHGWSSSPTTGWDGIANADDEVQDGRYGHPSAQAVRAPSSLLQPRLSEEHNTILECSEEDVHREGVDDDEEDYLDSSEGDLSESVPDFDESSGDSTVRQKPNFVRAFLDSAIPRDLRDNTVGIVKGDYVVEKKTLLHHATTSDQYDLFSKTRRWSTRNNDKDEKDKK